VEKLLFEPESITSGMLIAKKVKFMDKAKQALESALRLTIDRKSCEAMIYIERGLQFARLVMLCEAELEKRRDWRDE
jgi:hypothetical protein